MIWPRTRMLSEVERELQFARHVLRGHALQNPGSDKLASNSRLAKHAGVALSDTHRKLPRMILGKVNRL